MSDYYKSLISDDEVIRALVKESKRREGTLPTNVPRFKPNLNFFQRTVSNLVSTNRRIDKNVDTFRTDYLKESKVKKYSLPVYKCHVSKKPLVDYAFEKQLVLQTKINFVREGGCSKPKKISKKPLKPLSFTISDEDSDNSDCVMVSGSSKPVVKKDMAICISSDEESDTEKRKK